MGLAGAGLTIAAIGMVWLAHALFRMRLEVLPDTVWVFPFFGKPREVQVGTIASLDPLVSSNAGGIVARGRGREKLFDANRTMLGYPQLIEYLTRRRPDLVIPDGSRPIQGPPLE